MNRLGYLEAERVALFVAFFAGLLRGDRFSHRFEIRDRKMPPNYRARFGVWFEIRSLEDAFERYFWAGGDFEHNAASLTTIQRQVAAAISAENSPDACAQALDAIKAVMRWGAGGAGTKLYSANVKWAHDQGERLTALLRAGRKTIDSDDPDLAFFGRGGARMNAGYTKYYSLACNQSIIYDGRVGAALGLIVRKFCEARLLDVVPSEIAFLWGPQNPGNRSPDAARQRDPSDGTLHFKRLQPSQDAQWAQANIRANWIIEEAISQSGAPWCAGPDGMRRVEAALFMVGYEV